MFYGDSGNADDDFLIDGSGIDIDDLDYVSVQFKGGGRLDGQVMRFGMSIVPKEITACFEGSNARVPEVERYLLIGANPDVGLEYSAYFRYEPVVPK